MIFGLIKNHFVIDNITKGYLILGNLFFMLRNSENNIHTQLEEYCALHTSSTSPQLQLLERLTHLTFLKPQMSSSPYQASNPITPW